MLIFLDSLRSPKITKFDKTIRSFKEFIEVIDKYEVTFISLDYEIDSKTTAIDILWYLKDNNIKVPFINIHTRSNEARSNIRKVIKSYFPETIITFIKEL
jgi:hypothetical protein